MRKNVREKSRECHNHNKGKRKTAALPRHQKDRKQKQSNKRKSNKRTKSTKISSFFQKRGNRSANLVICEAAYLLMPIVTKSKHFGLTIYGRFAISQPVLQL